jgi:phosphoserine aminotransferase
VSDRKYNFSSGPAALPEPVLRRTQDAIWDLDGSGIGILEHSHRGPEFTAIIQRAEALIRELAGIPDDYAVMFLHGGASSQFFMVPMNLLPPDGSADFIVAGTWGQKAVAEAKRFGRAHVAASSEATNFDHVPDTASWSDAPAYVHITSNETIHGVQWHDRLALPAGAPLVVDASSDIFAGPLDITRFGLVYAGAQKNLGPAGVTVVIARKALVANPVRDLPTMLRYTTHVKDHSLHNTPSTFAIYVVGEVLAWIRAQGGLAAMAEINAAKATLLYDYLDQSRLFSGHARKDSRSIMNVTFRSGRPDLDAAFIAGAESRGLSGLGGHRSVGGMRASLYNAFPIEGVRSLVQYMEEFERTAR